MGIPRSAVDTAIVPMHRYLSFRVELLRVRPPIWRTFLLRVNSTFDDLHQAIQGACGWQGYHLYRFTAREHAPSIAGIPDDDAVFGAADPDANQIQISNHFAAPGASCIYQYDFGDNWLHKVTLKAAVELPERFDRRLLGGKRAFPPEDCGGIPGYDECIALRAGKSIGLRGAALRERIEWLGKWQPDAFDLAAAGKSFDR